MRWPLAGTLTGGAPATPILIDRDRITDFGADRLRWPLPPRITVGFAAAVVAVVTGGVVSAEALAVRRQNVAAVTHAFESLNALERLLDVVADAETGQRGYLLTGDEQYLRPYHDAVAAAPTALAGVREHVSGDAAREVDALAALVRQKLAELDLTVTLQRERGTAAALAVVRTDHGMHLMERIRASVARLEAEERRVVERRQAEWNRGVALTNGVFVVADVVLLVLIVLAARFVGDELREREEHARERERAMELQQQLMGIVGHDLRSPLSAVLTSAGLLLRAGDLPASRRPAAERIASSARRMERMIRDLLDFSRARAGQGIPVNAHSADLERICQRVVAEQQAENPGRTVQCRTEGNVVGTWDPDRLEQVISNLVSNALRHGAAGSPVSVTARGGEGEVVIEVHNEGPPIDPALVPHIFEPFRRGAPGQADRRSVGLGLFIVRTLVEAHRGGVEVRSAEGEGTTFRVRLPREPAVPAAEPVGTAAAAGAPPTTA